MELQQQQRFLVRRNDQGTLLMTLQGTPAWGAKIICLRPVPNQADVFEIVNILEEQGPPLSYAMTTLLTPPG